LALRITDIWVDTAFSGEERHVRRVEKINHYKGE
jgi:ribose 5-phosphate isomerase RpiB